MIKSFLEQLTTEKRNNATTTLDQLNIKDALKIMNEEDFKVFIAIKEVLPQVEIIINKAVENFKNGGRLIYIGSGTSGRLGILDAVECIPTFGIKEDKVIGLIAGGPEAFMHAVEGAEDSEKLAEEDLKKISLKSNDTLVGIAASGRTPYVVSALKFAKKLGVFTSSISCNKNSILSQHSKVSVEVVCGPEILTGSTRLKAGTAQKLILNMISTISMVQIGKVYSNLMVDLQPTNEKLVERSKNIIMQATGVNYTEATKYFDKAKKNVKLAIIMILTGVSEIEATEKLQLAKGFVSKTLKFIGDQK